ncbi:MAG: PIG-L family deacetylase [Chloroflexi bacterium]|nr:PIG-L family deacetylase [Chloroflexota bacterium]
MPENRGGVLFVHAHPDDECAGTGGTIARLVAEDVRVDLVTCTDGAEGEVHDPDLDPEEARPRLAEIRARELACSVQALGGGAIHHHLLGYRDSGMIGTEANEHADSFWKADLHEATRRLLAIVREARPAAIVSYDENGNYGHPDHINAARIARDACAAAADASAHPELGPPWRISRLYEIAFSREAWLQVMTEMRERGISLPWDMDETLAATPADELNPTNVAAVSQVVEALDEGARGEEVAWGVPDALITTRVDVRAHLEAKRRSMDCHRTQRQDLGWMLELPHDLADRLLGTEHYVLRRVDGKPMDPSHRETWLLP